MFSDLAWNERSHRTHMKVNLESSRTHELFVRLAGLGFYRSPASNRCAHIMSLPKPGDNVKVTLMSGETIEGVVEWIDGGGAWVKGTQKNRWVPLEAFQPPPQADDSKDDE